MRSKREFSADCAAPGTDLKQPSAETPNSVSRCRSIALKESCPMPLARSKIASGEARSMREMPLSVRAQRFCSRSSIKPWMCSSSRPEAVFSWPAGCPAESNR